MARIVNMKNGLSKQICLWLAAAAFLVVVSPARAADPFDAQASWINKDGARQVRVAFTVPAGHFLYADHLKIAAGDIALTPLEAKSPVSVLDKFTGEKKDVYDGDFALTFGVPEGVERVQLSVAYQGCNDSVCFFPQKKTFSLGDAESGGEGGVGESDVADPASADWRGMADQFSVRSRAVGYLGKEDFLAFLGRGETGAAADEDFLARSQRLGWLITVLLILVGGVGLNLTPCVLPLIPVNLAIIGAGARAGSKTRGFLLGGAYGAGMAAVYGVLGLIVVLTGSKFGTLNASPWFNAVIAVIFILLSLSMFDVFSIDLTRFQGRAGAVGGRKGQVAAALVMGAVAALLAGACVAPVVISVLLLSGNLYAKGQVLGLLLPFLLGVGMGLPWPFAGAGLSFLPKPGKWMTVVKYVFGVIILVLAIYYGHLAWGLFRDRAPATGDVAEASELADRSGQELATALQRSLAEGKPVFIDFWATWCKNCHAMEKTTFRDPEVLAQLDRFIVVKYQAEVPNESPAREVLDHFGAVGLPTYVVLVPAAAR